MILWPAVDRVAEHRQQTTNDIIPLWELQFQQTTCPNVWFSNTREVHDLQKVVMFVCLLCIKRAQLSLRSVRWFTEQHGFRGNSTICVQWDMSNRFCWWKWGPWYNRREGLFSWKPVSFSAITFSPQVDTWIQRNGVMRNHMQYIYHMWLTTHTQTFSSSLYTVIVFNLIGGYQPFKAAYYLCLHCKVTPKHITTHCQNADATVQVCTTVNTTMLHT